MIWAASRINGSWSSRSPVEVPGADAVGDERDDGADDDLGGETLFGFGPEQPGLASVGLGDDVDEPLEREPPLLDQRGPGRVDLDEEERASAGASWSSRR